MVKVNIHLHVENLTLEELVALRQKIEQFLEAESRAKLLTFQATEQGE